MGRLYKPLGSISPWSPTIYVSLFKLVITVTKTRQNCWWIIKKSLTMMFRN